MTLIMRDFLKLHPLCSGLLKNIKFNNLVFSIAQLVIIIVINIIKIQDDLVLNFDLSLFLPYACFVFSPAFFYLASILTFDPIKA